MAASKLHRIEAQAAGLAEWYRPFEVIPDGRALESNEYALLFGGTYVVGYADEIQSFVSDLSITAGAILHHSEQPLTLSDFSSANAWGCPRCGWSPSFDTLAGLVRKVEEHCLSHVTA